MRGSCLWFLNLGMSGAVDSLPIQVGWKLVSYCTDVLGKAAQSDGGYKID